MKWNLDSAHSALTVSAKHMMVTNVRGRMAITNAEIDFDPEQPERASITATIDAASIDTGSAQRDQHLRSADFLDVEQHPVISFRSTSVEPVRGVRYRLNGELTIRGVTRLISLDAEIVGVVADWRGGMRAAFTATTSVNREAFGLNWNVALETGGWLVGRDLKVEIELAALQAAEGQQAAA
jgi:polyisoprenoid-binding protein YceI